jgi:acyl-CoA synthetase (AMP-forming)/AMP-acid ligase II
MPQPDIATIADVVRVHAAKRPDAIALVVGERIITFADLDARSSQAAQAFRAAGVGSGDRVAFVMYTSGTTGSSKGASRRATTTTSARPPASRTSGDSTPTA